MQVKTSELSGAALDWAVATLEGVCMENFYAYYTPLYSVEYDKHGFPEFHYSSVWSQGGPIIERECLAVWWCDAILNEDDTVHSEECWYAELSEPTERGNFGMTGPTPLIAAMRCYVASKLGDTVDIPEELL